MMTNVFFRFSNSSSPPYIGTLIQTLFVGFSIAFGIAVVSELDIQHNSSSSYNDIK
jgi:hypothetical protein